MDSTKKLIDTYKKQGPLTQGAIADVFATTPENTPITSASLSDNPKPIQIPQQTPSTTADGISGSTTAILEADKIRQQEQEKKQAADIEIAKVEEPKQGFYDKLLSNLGLQRQSQQQQLGDVVTQQNSLIDQIGTTKKNLTTAGRNEFGLDTLETTRRKALQDLRTSQVRELSELKALEGQNLTGAGSASAQAGIKRKYGMEQLEAQLSYHLANDDITAAEKTIADRITLETEPLYKKLDLTENVYDQIKDSLSSTENKEWTTTINKINKEIEETEAVGSFAKEVAKNGAPAEILNKVINAKTVGEAAGAAGIYAGDVLERQKKALEVQKLNKEIQALGVPQITNPQAGQYAGALNILLGSGSFTKDQKATLINAVNNGQDPFSVIKNQAKNIMGQTNATKLDNYETAKQQLLDVQIALEQYYAAGGDTNLLKGNYEKVINKLGEVKDPNLVQISTQIQSALQIYRNAVSGTAYSVQEGADIASIFPGINKSEGLNKAVLTGRMNAFDSTIDATYKNVLGDTYTTLKKAETAQQVQDVGVPKVIPQTQVPEGYYQASDGLFYKK